jgi:hypothetical protein
MNPLLMILVFVLALQAIAFVIAIVARNWVLHTETFEMRGIDVARATELVAIYVEGVHDHRFGFPTGVFAVDTDRTSPGRVVAREINFQGSAGMGPIRFGLKLPLLGAVAGAAMGSDDDAGSCFAGMIGSTMGFMIGAAAAMVLVVPFAFLALVEVVLRTLMRGEISATIDRAPGEEDCVRVRFALRGLSAFGVEHQLRRGMAPPQPAGVSPPPVTAAAAAGPPPSRFDRLNAIYVSAVSVGLVVSIAAIIAIGNAQQNGSTASASSAAYYEEEASGYEEEAGYEEEGYEEEPYEEEGYEEPGYEEEEESAAATRYDAAREMYLRYWEDIDAGSYGAAYNIYYHTFATEEGISQADFVSAEQSYLPDVGLEHITLESSSRDPTSPNELWLYAEIPIRDGNGEYAGQCRVFYGDLRMFHADGRWYYRPGEAFGRVPSFGGEGGGIRTMPSYSERCS